MQLSLQNFTSLVQGFASAVQSSASALVDFTVGSILRAIGEATAGVGLWLQYIALQVLSVTRAATSVGTDLDSFMADYGVTRLPATAATGLLTFARYSPQAGAIVPVGATAITTDGTQTFTVVADTTNGAYSASQNGYVVAASTASVTVTAQAVTAGSGGNVVAGAITQLGTAIPGIDTVSNAAPFINGIDAESDAALRARFQNFLSTRDKGTLLAVQYAIASVQQGLNYTVEENLTPSGTTQMGFFTVTIDDGSGAPPSSLISAANAAIQLVRPIGSSFTVQPPAVTTANVAFAFTTSPTSKKSGLLPTVENAVQAFIDALPVGAPLPYSRIAAVIYAVDPSITNVTGLTVNSATADITVSATGVVKAGTVTAS